MSLQLFSKLLASTGILCLVLVLFNVFNNFTINVALLFAGILFAIAWVLLDDYSGSDNFTKTS